MSMIESVIARLQRVSSFWRNVGVISVGVVCAQAIAVAAYPIISRIYTPRDFGGFGVFLSTIAILQVASSLCYERAIPLPKNVKPALALLALCGVILLVSSACVGVVSAYFGQTFVEWAQVPTLAEYLWVLPVCVLLGGFYEVLTNWALRSRAYGDISTTKVVKSLGLVVGQVGFGLMRIGVFGLLLGEVVGRSCGNLRLAFPIWRDFRREFTGLRLADLGVVARRYSRFAMISCPATVINECGFRIRPILLSVLFGPQVAGWFLLCQMTFSVPLSLLGGSVAQVYFAEAAGLVRSNPLGLRRLLLATARRSAALAIGPLVAVAVVSPFAFPLVFGSEWRVAGEYVALLAIGQFAALVVSPISRTLLIVERQGLELIWSVFRLGLCCGAVFLVYYLSSSAHMAILALGICDLLAYAVLFGLIQYAVGEFACRAECSDRADPLDNS
jgi:O-antigen/teichoic acid export membrane protein